jgi:hypothetical protein
VVDGDYILDTKFKRAFGENDKKPREYNRKPGHNRFMPA